MSYQISTNTLPKISKTLGTIDLEWAKLKEALD